MKRIFLKVLPFALLTLACQETTEVIIEPEEEKHECNDQLYQIAIDGLTKNISQDDTLLLKAKHAWKEGFSLEWKVDDKIVSNDSVFAFSRKDVGFYDIKLSLKHDKGTIEEDAYVNVESRYLQGMYILNEGNMSNETGTLIHINHHGTLRDSLFIKTNGYTLGNVSQDLTIANGNMYVIAQNASAGNMLVVIDPITLQEISCYSEQIKETLSWPSHIGVLGKENIYIRDNKGVYHFNPHSQQLTLVTGSQGANKNRMATIGDRLFFASRSNLNVIEKGGKEVANTITLTGNITGIEPSHDGKLWISTSSPSQIIKFDPSTLSIIKTNAVTETNISASFAATPAITSKGDTLYFSNLTTKIYRHIFSTNETKLMADVKTMIEDANLVYNTIGVNPDNGLVYINTLKGYGQAYKENQITAIDMNSETPRVVASYINETRFPAGFFFVNNFR